MKNINCEFELFKLIMCPDEYDTDVSYVNDYGWVDGVGFLVWIKSEMLSEFISRLINIFGYSLFYEDSIEARIGSDYVCINLEECVTSNVKLERIFPKNEYQL